MKIFQITNHSKSQMMGYILISKLNKVVVIDGGCAEDSFEIRQILSQHNNHVDMWLLTHPHYDHNSALIEIIKKPDGLVVDGIYYSYLPDEWGANEPAYHQNIIDINAYLAKSSWKVQDLMGNEHFLLDDLSIDVLGISNPDIIVNAFNNSSCVFKIQESDFSFLILGDLGVEGGQRLMKNHGDRLRSTAVQMAHHGQNGVAKDVYQSIAPRFAFWPTPDWLWNNTSDPDKPGQGPWETLNVRRWMDELHTINITSLEKTVVFDTDTGIY
ncbi:MAG: ComEC/Rec2 family competence protein [Saccharofermentanales bacterium]